MILYYPYLGYKTECKKVAITFPAQHQSVQPGLETLMCPRPIWTLLQPASYSVEYITTIGLDTPMRRAGKPVELAPTYVYASYVTGQILHVDGGSFLGS